VATATDTRTSRDRAPAVDDNIVDLTPAELEQLWAALDGDWITVLISLWPSWGFCPPHAFGFAITEVELQPRAFTTGPFRTAILYEHFLEGAAKIASARPRTWRGIRLFLSPRTDCFICERLASTHSAAPEQTRDFPAPFIRGQKPAEARSNGPLPSPRLRELLEGFSWIAKSLARLILCPALHL
jgi:hypothetical protein